ncbi:MAG TPA: BTAD domain-containing putative transcriptional regulator [Chloroflexota bacterium]
MNIRLLGALQIERGGERLGPGDFAGRKPKQLLEILLNERGHIVPRDRLIELLWPADPPLNADATLDTYVSLVRKRLGSGELRSVKPGYLIDCSHAEVDVDRFEALAQQASAAREAGDLPAAESALAEARSLYHGPYLEDEAYAEWALGPRERLGEVYQHVLLSSAELAAARGDFQAALSLTEQALARAPDSEPAVRQLMLWLYALGRENEALQAYDRLRRTLLADLGVEPAPATTEQHARMLQGVPAAQLLEETLPRAHRRTSQLPELPFLDRQPELAAIQDAFHDSADGVLLLLVEGQAGIGKSELIGRFLRQVPVRFGQAKCTELQRDLPFGGLSAALADLIRKLEPAEAERVRAAAPELSELVPELGSSPASAALPPDLARTRLLDGVALSLEAAAPLVLFVDDLQWGDVSTVQALDRILQRVAAARILLVIACRSVTPVISQLAATAEAAGRLRHITLGPLPRQALDALLARGVDTGELWAVTAGHPLFVVERLRAQAGMDLQGAILSRVRRSSASAQQLLQAASVFERPFRPGILGEVAGQSDELLVRGVEELLEQRLLVDAGGQFRLPHDLIRGAIYDDLSPARREHLHRRALAALETAGAPAGELASHALAAGQQSGALKHSIAAAEQALELYANVEAAAHLGRAIELIRTRPEVADPGQLQSLLIRRAQALIVVGSTDEAASFLREAAELARAARDHRRELEATHWLGMTFWSAWRPSLALPHAIRALELAEQMADTRLVGRAHAFLANPHGSLGHLDDSLLHAQQALAMFEELGEDPPAMALFRIGLTRHQRAEERAALDALERGEPLALRQHDERTVIFIRWVRASILANLGQYEAAWAQLAAAEAFGRGEEAVARARIPNTRAAFFADLGLWEEALEHDLESLDAIPAGGGQGVKEPLIHTLLNLAEDHLALGAADRAQAAVDRVMRIMPDAEYARFRYENRLHYVRGRLALAREDWSAALHCAEACHAHASTHSAPKYYIRAHLVKGQALLRLGEGKAAQIELDRAGNLADRLGYAAWSWRAWLQAGDEARAGKAVRRLARELGLERRDRFLQAAKRFSKGANRMLAP